MSEPCPKCGANRTLFEGQTSWECGSYRRVLGGPDICTVQVEFTEGEHCKTKQALEAAKRRIAELENEVQRLDRNSRHNLDGKREQERIKKAALKANRALIMIYARDTAKLQERIENTEAAIRKMLPDFNCRMFEPYYKLLKDLLPD